MLKTIFYSLSGQGSKTITNILCNVLIKKNLHLKLFPDYSASRKGTPMFIYLKIDKEKIYSFNKFEKTDHLIIFDETLKNEKMISNSKATLLNSKEKETKNVITINASEISQENINNLNSINISLLGAYTKILEKELKINLINEIIKEYENYFKQKLKEELLLKNIKIIKESYEKLK